MVALTAIHDWVDAPGSVVSWGPSPGCLAKVAEAPVSDVPASYQQEQHIRAYREHTGQRAGDGAAADPGVEHPGPLRHPRDDATSSTPTCAGTTPTTAGSSSTTPISCVRHTVANPADIQFVATKHGEMTSAQWREHILDTPSPLQWDCFRFGIIQRADHFTFYACIDHVHADAMFMVALFVEMHMNYAALVEGGAPTATARAGPLPRLLRPPAGVHLRAHPRVAGGRRLDRLPAEATTARLPKFPLPLGDPDVPCTGDLITVKLMDAHDTDRFESVCAQAGVRFIGGVFACAAIAERELTGAQTYHVITPTTTRSTPAEFMTTGWFTGIVPLSVPTDGYVVHRGGPGRPGGLRRRDAPGERADRTGDGTGPRRPRYPQARSRVCRCCPISTSACRR